MESKWPQVSPVLSYIYLPISAVQWVWTVSFLFRIFCSLLYSSMFFRLFWVLRIWLLLRTFLKFLIKVLIFMEFFAFVYFNSEIYSLIADTHFCLVYYNLDSSSSWECVICNYLRIPRNFVGLIFKIRLYGMICRYGLILITCSQCISFLSRLIHSFTLIVNFTAFAFSLSLSLSLSLSP